ncbi:hypothetical protein HTV45_29435 [Streptomyces sp. CHD11]|uniref:hypothetical protein n=1 Tax=Streptomyces sp. CHD11 TaxID=2741325 RepID=UPI001BFC59EB|nr:hypothetical protein [Streptomyces sp. CHD11]MBT3154947.1 hypothetical protein [Streptomyces sp. CHD11]
MTRRSQDHHEAYEQRLRDALEARAGSVDWEHLRPAGPPAGAGRSFPVRRTVIGLVGLAAAAACVLFVVEKDDPGRPAGPADRPSRTPSPSVTPSLVPLPGENGGSQGAATEGFVTPSPTAGPDG